MYDYDDPLFTPRRLHRDGLGLVAGFVLGQEAGEPLPATWMRHRPLCAETDPEMFFPTVGDTVNSAQARRICQLCPIVDDCLEHNLEERHGIWGGTSETQRRVLRRRANGVRAAAPKAPGPLAG